MTFPRFGSLLAVIGLAAACSGCLTSLSPFFPDDARIFEPRLLGVWGWGESGGKDSGIVAIRANSDSLGYDITYLAQNDSTVGRFEGRLARIEGVLVFDLESLISNEWEVPSGHHIAYLIEMDSDTLRARFTKDDARMLRLLSHQENYDGILVPGEGKGDTDDLLMVTDSESLVEFLERCVLEEEFWTERDEGFVFRRVHF